MPKEKEEEKRPRTGDALSRGEQRPHLEGAPSDRIDDVQRSEGSELSVLTPSSYTMIERVERLRRENRVLRQEILRQHRVLARQKPQSEVGAANAAATSLPGTAQEEALRMRIQTLERKNAREVARRTAAEREYRYEIELLRLALDEAAVSGSGTRGGGGSGMSRPSSPQTAFPPGAFHGRTVSQGESSGLSAASPSQPEERAPQATRGSNTQRSDPRHNASADAPTVELDTPAARLQKLFDARVAEHEQATNPWATNADTRFRQAATRREQRRMRLRGIVAEAKLEDGEGPLPQVGLAGDPQGTNSAASTGHSSLLLVDDTDAEADSPIHDGVAMAGLASSSASAMPLSMPGAERYQTNPILLTPKADALQPSRRVSQLVAGTRAGGAVDAAAPTAHADNTGPTSGRRGRPRRTTQQEVDAELDLATSTFTGTGGGAATATPVVNPNQIGVELSDDERTRSWYLKETLSVVLQQVVHRRTAPAAAAPLPVRPAAATAVPTPTRARDLGDASSASSDGGDEDPYGDYRATGGARTEANRHATQSAATLTSPFPQPQPSPKQTTDTVRTDDRGRVLVYKDVNPIALQRAIADSLHFHVHCVANNPVLCKPHEARALRLGSFASENDDPNLLAAFSPEHMSEEVKAVQRAGAEESSDKRTRKDRKTSTHTGEFRDDELEVTVHAPIIFTQVRSFVGLDIDRFLSSLELSTWRQSMSPGKSGTTLLYFGDCVMKSMKDSEFEFLMQRYLPQYVPYCERYPHSLLPQIYAVISVQWLKLGVTRRFFLMQNVFSTQYYIHRIYDVKGSTVNRTAMKPGQPAPRTPFGALMLKDNDLPPQLIICGEHQRAILVAQLRSDVHFLQSLNIVDYSCMIGVRSRIFTREEGPSRTVLLRRQMVGGTALDVGATVANGALALDDSLSLGHHADGAAGGAGSAADEDDLFVCIHGCDGGLLSLPIYSPGDDTTAREDVYYIGIIDVLQEYNKTKKFENFAKGFVNDRKQISVIPPKEYSERLCRVIERISV